MASRKPRATKDFFISHTGADRRWAEWVAAVLESEGYTTIFQSWDFPVGGNFVERMNQSLESCRRTVLIYSPAYFKSLYAQAEWSAALTMDPTGKRRQLLPIRVKPCAPAAILRPIAYVDLVGVVESEARNRIALAAQPASARLRTSDGFPGERQRSGRTVLDVARDLRDVLNTTRVTFVAQAEARDKLYRMLRKRLKVRDSLEYEDFFHQYFDQMNPVELRRHAIIRAYTKDVLRDYNKRALALGKELQQLGLSSPVDLEAEVPHAYDLHEHLTVWLQKYRSAIRVPSTCLVYLGPAESMGFPTEVDQELEDLVEAWQLGSANASQRKRRGPPRRSDRGRGEG